jgi:hypothetical protein
MRLRVKALRRGDRELQNVNFTIATILDYTLPAEKGTWQEEDGKPRLNIWSYVRVNWPCPYDGDMVNAEIQVEANFDYFSIAKVGWCGLHALKLRCDKSVFFCYQLNPG